MVKGILPTPGGGITLLAEQYFETEIVRETYTVDKYHFNDVIAFGINGEGETTWSVRGPKKQVGVGTPLNQSFIHGRVGEKVYLIFNDHPKNVGVKDLDNPALLLADKDAVITVVAIDDSGKHTREPLFSTREEGTIISPSLFQKISEKEWLVHLEQKKSFRFATILFD